MVQISFYDNDTGEFIKQWPNWTGVLPAVYDVVVMHYGDRNEEEREYVVHMRVIDGTRPDHVKLLIKQINLGDMKEIKLDEHKLQEMAQQYAMQGAEKAIKDFYTGYDSPFMKEVQRQLSEKMETNLFFELSQMTAAINQALNNKVSEMANTVVANTFLPMLNRMFSQERKTVVTTQDLYEHFGDAMKEDLDDEFDPENMELLIEQKGIDTILDHRKLRFCYCGETKFSIYLMESSRHLKDDNGNTLYMITELPGCSQYRMDNYPRERQMRIRLNEGATLEMPFTPDVLRDEFMRYVAGLLLTNTMVIIKNYHEYHLEEE